MSNGNTATKTTGKGVELSVGLFLAVRDIKRANIWTTFLIVAVMVLTFLNLVVVSGILIGLIEGTVIAVKERFLSDVFISALKNHPYIEHTPDLATYVGSLPYVANYTVRYIEGGTIEGNYKSVKKASELRETVSASFAGIIPSKEDTVSHLSSKMVEGEYLSDDDYDEVVLGAMLFRKYLDLDSTVLTVLGNDIGVGSKIRITVNGNSREVTIKGIIKTKVDEIDRRVFFTASQFRTLINRYDYSANEIAVELKPGMDPIVAKNAIIAAGFDRYAKIQTAEDAEPKFVKDLKSTFAILGNIISSVGLAVAAITVFIVIFINAITRRKFIGILKGIGITNFSIELSYIIQSIFYAVCGIIIGVLLIFFVLKPYFAANPINFPFGDGILVATAYGTSIRAVILLIATIIAGYIPARIVINQNTLDAILGR